MGKGDFKKIYILQTDLEGKKFLQGNTLLIKTPTLEKISFMAYNVGKKILIHCMSGKKSITRSLEKKQTLTQTKLPIATSPPTHSKVKWSAPLGIDKEPLKKRVPFGE